MPGFGKTLKQGFIDAYDYLGLIVVSSCLWFASVLLSVFLIHAAISFSIVVGALAGVTLYSLVVAPVTASVFYMCRNIAVREEPSVGNLITGLREFFAPSAGLAMAQVIVTTIICVNGWFYLTRGGVLTVLGVLFVYLMLVWCMSGLYHYPLLVEQRASALKILKRGFLLSVDNPRFTSSLFFVIIVLTGVGMVTFLGMPLLYAGVVGIIEMRALRALFVKYGLFEMEPTVDSGSENSL